MGAAGEKRLQLAAALVTLAAASWTLAATDERWRLPPLEEPPVLPDAGETGRRPAPRPQDLQAPEGKSPFGASCGPFGVFCPEPFGDWPSGAIPVSFSPDETTSRGCPSIRGFLDLGPSGTGGDIDGPGGDGDGTFKTLERADDTVSLEIKTGYVDARISLVQDPKTCDRAMVVRGKVRGKEVDGKNEVAITYDADSDEGTIAWKENGKEKAEDFWKGEDGDTKMTIELGGGYNHDFTGRKAPPR